MLLSLRMNSTRGPSLGNPSKSWLKIFLDILQRVSNFRLQLPRISEIWPSKNRAHVQLLHSWIATVNFYVVWEANILSSETRKDISIILADSESPGQSYRIAISSLKLWFISRYSRTPVERPPSPMTIPLIRPYFVWRTVFSVCTIPDQRPSLRRDQRPSQMGFSPSRTTTSPTVYFQESCLAVQHPFPIMYYYNVVRVLDTFQVIHLIWTFFYFGDDATMTFSDRRYDVASPPALRYICSRV